MAGGTLSTTIKTEITLGSAAYLSPLTITAKGVINAPGASNGLQSASAIYVGLGVSGGTIINRGLVVGATPAADTYTVPAISASSPINLVNYGTIDGQSGVYLNTGGSAVNSGLIQGLDGRASGGYGVRLINAGLSNGGMVYGVRYGVASWNLGNIVNTGTISGKLEGVKLETSTVASGGTLVNSGTIESLQTGVSAASGLITNSGKITGGSFGVYVAWGGTIANSGLITGGSDGVVLLNKQGQAVDDAWFSNSGSIQGGYFGLAVNSANASNSASGVISGQTFGVGVGDGGDLQNFGNIYGSKGGLVVENAGIAINSGTIHSNVIGVYVFEDGNVTNAAAGTISGLGFGVKNISGYLDNAGNISGNGLGVELLSAGIAVNSGRITGANGEGVYLSQFNVNSLTAPDFLLNTGTIYGKTEGILLNTGTAYNFGFVSGGTTGVSMAGNGTLDNAGTISGAAYGVRLSNAGGGTITNSGTISGAKDAIYGTDFTLTVGAGAAFTGDVVDETYKSTLNLGGAAVGSLAGIGSQFIGISNINFEGGSHWTISGDAAGLASGQTITGFGPGETIVLNGFAATGETFVPGIGLEVFAGTNEITLDITGGFKSSQFIVVDPLAVTTITTTANAPCFAARTRIMTPRGETAVEYLRVGDTVITRLGEDKRIIWIGRRKLDLGRHPHPKEVQPICIAADALAEGTPSRDLWLSPDHALYIDGHLIPAKSLLNGSNIYQANRTSITYYHIELAEHAVIFAENAAVETYLETGNRGAFENGGADAIILHPDFGVTVRAEKSCARLVTSGRVVDEIRMRVMGRFRGGEERKHFFL
jgi:hypothetical protein